MNLILRLVGIHEEHDYSHEAKIDEALQSMPLPHSKAVIESLYEKFPAQIFLRLDVRVRKVDGEEIGSLAMRASDWPGTLEVGNEIDLTTVGAFAQRESLLS